MNFEADGRRCVPIVCNEFIEKRLALCRTRLSSHLGSFADSTAQSSCVDYQEQ